MKTVALLVLAIALTVAISTTALCVNYGALFSEDTMGGGISVLQAGGAASRDSGQGPAPYAGTVRTPKELMIVSRKISSLYMLTR